MVIVFFLLAAAMTGLAVVVLTRQSLRAAGDRPSRVGMLVTAGLFPLVVAATYLAVGSPALLSKDPSPSSAQVEVDMKKAIAALERRLLEQPDDEKAFNLLFRTLVVVQSYQEALELVRAHAPLNTQTAALLAMEAEALALLAGGTVNSEVSSLIDRALELDSENFAALWLAGHRASQQGDHALAASRFERASELASEPSMRQQLSIQAQNSRDKRDGVQGKTLTVEVRIAPGLAKQVDPAHALFVYAREVGGPPLPVAAVRLEASALPATVVLDDSAAMLAARRLSDFAKVDVLARVSASGDAIPAAGDFAGTLGEVALEGHTSVTLTISRVLD